MSLKRECELLRELNASLKEQIKALEQILQLKPDRSYSQFPALIPALIPSQPNFNTPHQGFDSFRFRGWPWRCSDNGGTCVFHAVPGLDNRGLPGGSTTAPMEARCRHCGHPPITSAHVVENGNPNLTGSNRS